MNSPLDAPWKIPVQILIGVSQELELQGIGRPEFLAGTGLSPALLDDPSHRISIHKYIELLQRASDLSAKPGLGLDVGSRQTPSSWGVLGYAVNCCATAREALLTGARFSRIAASFNRLHLVESKDVAFWVATPPMDFGRVLPFVMEFEFVSFLRSAALVTGRTDAVLEMHCSYPPPPYAERYQEYFNVPVKFNTSRTQVLIDPAALDFPVLQASPVNTSIAVRMCEEFLAKQTLGDDLPTQVRCLLLENPGTFPNAEQVAQSLHMTSRTLRSKLAEVGTSYQKILDGTREQLARDWLLSTHSNTDDIAWKMGFHDTVSFRRAFKKWTGQTPSGYRRQHSR